MLIDVMRFKVDPVKVVWGGYSDQVLKSLAIGR